MFSDSFWAETLSLSPSAGRFPALTQTFLKTMKRSRIGVNFGHVLVSKGVRGDVQDQRRGPAPERLTPVVLLKEARGRSDAGLVEECRQGDSTAFDELVRRYKDRIFNVVFRFLGNREDALDVTQEAFVRAYRGIREFKGAAKVYTWLYSIAANLARNHLRDTSRKGRGKGVSLDDAPQAVHEAVAARQDPSSLLADREMDGLLQKCLEEVPDHYRLAFVLRTFEDLSYEEIANIMGCPVGTVKSRLNQARRMLLDRLKELEVL